MCYYSFITTTYSYVTYGILRSLQPSIERRITAAMNLLLFRCAFRVC